MYISITNYYIPSVRSIFLFKLHRNCNNSFHKYIERCVLLLLYQKTMLIILTNN